MTALLWPLPLSLCEVTSPFGPRPAPTPGASRLHNGVDVRCPQGTELRVPDDGLVAAVWTDRKTGGGLSVSIDLMNGLRIGVCHLSELAWPSGHHALRKEDRVHRGDLFAYTGGTPGTLGAGRGTGPHLHLVVRRKSGDRWVCLDPMSIEWVDAAGAPVTLRLAQLRAGGAS